MSTLDCTSDIPKKGPVKSPREIDKIFFRSSNSIAVLLRFVHAYSLDTYTELQDKWPESAWCNAALNIATILQKLDVATNVAIYGSVPWYDDIHQPFHTALADRIAVLGISDKTKNIENTTPAMLLEFEKLPLDDPEQWRQDYFSVTPTPDSRWLESAGDVDKQVNQLVENWVEQVVVSALCIGALEQRKLWLRLVESLRKEWIRIVTIWNIVRRFEMEIYIRQKSARPSLYLIQKFHQSVYEIGKRTDVKIMMQFLRISNVSFKMMLLFWLLIDEIQLGYMIRHDSYVKRL